MHESATTQIQSNVRHFAVDVEEQYVTYSEICPINNRQLTPQLAGRARHHPASPSVGELHQTAAIEAMRIVATVGIGNTDLSYGNRGCLFTDRLISARRRIARGSDYGRIGVNGSGMIARACAKNAADEQQSGSATKTFGW